MNDDGLVSYAEAQQFAERRINDFETADAEEEASRQTPTLEVLDDKVAYARSFGVERKRPMYAQVVLGTSKQLSLDLGAIHGIRPGQRLGLYASVSALGRGVDPMVQLEVTSVELEAAEARVLSGQVNNSASGLVAAPLADPLAVPDALIWTETEAVEALDDHRSRAEALRLLRAVNTRIVEMPRVRIDARDTYDLRLTILHRSTGAQIVKLVLEVTEANGRRHDAGEYIVDMPMLPNRLEEITREVVLRIGELIGETRNRRSLAALTNPRPGFGLQAVVDRRPPEGKTLAEYRQGDSLVFGLKSTANCYYYIVAIDPAGKPEVWCPKPGQEHFAPAGRKLLHPGPAEKLTMAGPAGVYVVKLLAVREKLPADAFVGGLPRPAVFRSLRNTDWSEGSVSLRVLAE